MKQFTVSILPLVCLIIFSCKKSDSSSAKTPSEIISEHKWKLYRVGYTEDDVNIDWTTVTAQCELDATYDFNKNGIFTLDLGENRCDQSDPRIYMQVPWKFVTPKLISLDNGAGVDLQILNLTPSSLTFIEQDGPGSHECYDLIPL